MSLIGRVVQWAGEKQSVNKSPMDSNTHSHTETPLRVTGFIQLHHFREKTEVPASEDICQVVRGEGSRGWQKCADSQPGLCSPILSPLRRRLFCTLGQNSAASIFSPKVQLSKQVSIASGPLTLTKASQRFGILAVDFWLLLWWLCFALVKWRGKFN